MTGLFAGLASNGQNLTFGTHRLGPESTQRGRSA